MPVRYPESYLKTLNQLSLLSKEPFTVENKVYSPPEKLILSSSFFREYHCELECGGCCLMFTLDYLPGSPTPPGVPYRGRETLSVNGVSREIITLENPVVNTGDRWVCGYLDLRTAECTIHGYHPFSCEIELIKFRKLKGNGYIMKAPYGRSWRMYNQCTKKRGDVRCWFSPTPNKQAVNDIEVLLKMLNWANYFGISTWLPEVIEVIQNWRVHHHEEYTKDPTPIIIHEGGKQWTQRSFLLSLT